MKKNLGEGSGKGKEPVHGLEMNSILGIVSADSMKLGVNKRSST